MSEETRKRASARDEEPEGFTAEERAAMKERARELKAAQRAGTAAEKRAAAEAEVLARIAEMGEGDRALAEQLHRLVKEVAPSLDARTWYGMPAYAREGKVLCFFQGAEKFGSRYSTLGFNDAAQLDDGDMWPASFALLAWTPAVEESVRSLLRRALRG